MSNGGFKSLLVWQKAQTLAVDIYQLSKSADFSREFALADQMRRAAISIPSNIAKVTNGIPIRTPCASSTSLKARLLSCALS